MASIVPVTLTALNLRSLRRSCSKGQVRPKTRRAPRIVATAHLNKDDRQTWFASSQSLTYLDGSLPGDVGFDPLGLSDPEGAGAFVSPRWLAYAEVVHARWAMLGALGMLAPEMLGDLGVIPAGTGVEWFRSGVIPPLGAFDYWADPYALFVAQMVLMGFAEHRRAQDFYTPGYGATAPLFGLERVLGGSKRPPYPGGPFFNFARLGRSKAETRALRTAEAKHGRVAMLACLGCLAQALVTGSGPWRNLLDHLADPAGNNVLAYVGLL
ncbi:hypothetical protein CLOM_g23190 [Closterium sp. NIES-68]|nr:hypothetical protein CLOM_g23190 [Closterium sp. NIES-68]GJP77025.1 hypothetical protein CLOP_g7459 [Closterium sp. NIES-67]